MKQRTEIAISVIYIEECNVYDIMEDGKDTFRQRHEVARQSCC